MTGIGIDDMGPDITRGSSIPDCVDYSLSGPGAFPYRRPDTSIRG